MDDIAAALRDIIKETPCNVALITGLKHGTLMHMSNLGTSLKILSRDRQGFAFATIHEVISTSPLPCNMPRWDQCTALNKQHCNGTTGEQWKSVAIRNEFLGLANFS